MTSIPACEKSETKWSALVYGHAGSGLLAGRYVYPPNTYESVAYALNVLDADGVEIDVRFTADSCLVLWHDEKLDAGSNGTGCVEEYTLAELQQLKSHSSYRIPTLTEVLEICVQRQKYVMLDVKSLNACNDQLVDFTKANVALNKSLAGLSHEQKQKIVFNSRSYDLLLAVQDTSLRISYETDEVDEAIANFDPSEVDMLVFRRTIVSESQSQTMRSLGIPFCLYGLLSQREIRHALSLKPNQIISDNIAYAQKQTH